MKMAIVISTYNQDITENLLAGALKTLNAADIAKQDILTVKVPGAIEIPLIAQTLARTKKYAAIICLGAVIRGETDHYDYVCQQVSDGCLRVMLHENMPVIFGVLTTNTLEQAYDRLGGKEGHKGEEAAHAALHMAKLMQELQTNNFN